MEHNGSAGVGRNCLGLVERAGSRARIIQCCEVERGLVIHDEERLRFDTKERFFAIIREARTKPLAWFDVA